MDMTTERPGNRSPTESPEPKPYSLRFHLLFGLNLAVVLILAAFAAWDYHNEWQTQLSEKRIALRDEAKTLLPGIRGRAGDPDFVQDYIDDVCGRMQDATSPGHHIAAQIGDRVLQARAHHRQSKDMIRAMQAAAADPDGIAASEGGELVVGQASSSGMTVFVSEYVSNIREILRAQILRRLLSIVCLGAILALVVSYLVDRMVTRPLNSVVGAVRRVSGGKLGTQVPATGSRELSYLANEFNSMSSALQETDRERRREMTKARRIQENLKPAPAAYEGLPVAHVYRPATEVAGDYFDIVHKENGQFVVCIADVTGHGVPAAMGVAMLKTLFGRAVHTTNDPAEILQAMHEGFVPVSLDEDFAT
ncbi:MAG: SpoIIE family protein phosphatase, partial [Planctomycetota bacterium]